MTELTCIVCPKGCHLNVDEKNGYAVTGNSCERGMNYGKKELTHPTRRVTSTVKTRNAILARVPVKTSEELPKEYIQKAMEMLNDIVITAPLPTGTAISEKIADTDVRWVTTRKLNKAD